MSAIKFNASRVTLALKTEDLTSVDALKTHALVIGSMDAEGQFLAVGWLKSLSIEDGHVKATAYPALVSDEFERTIYNPRLVKAEACPNCKIAYGVAVKLLGCDDTTAYTSYGPVKVEHVEVAEGED